MVKNVYFSYHWPLANISIWCIKKYGMGFNGSVPNFSYLRVMNDLFSGICGGIALVLPFSGRERISCGPKQGILMGIYNIKRDYMRIKQYPSCMDMNPIYQGVQLNIAINYRDSLIFVDQLGSFACKQQQQKKQFPSCIKQKG